jgi:hypothetical protein
MTFCPSPIMKYLGYADSMQVFGILYSPQMKMNGFPINVLIICETEFLTEVILMSEVF